MPFELSSILLLPDPEIKFIDPTHHYWLANCMAGIKLIHSHDFLLLFLFKDKALNPHSMVLVPWHGLLQLCMWVTEQWSPVVSNTRLTLALLYYPYPDVSLKYHPLSISAWTSMIFHYLMDCYPVFCDHLTVLVDTSQNISQQCQHRGFESFLTSLNVYQKLIEILEFKLIKI